MDTCKTVRGGLGVRGVPGRSKVHHSTRGNASTGVTVRIVRTSGIRALHSLCLYNKLLVQAKDSVVYLCQCCSLSGTSSVHRNGMFSTKPQQTIPALRVRTYAIFTLDPTYGMHFSVEDRYGITRQACPFQTIGCWCRPITWNSPSLTPCRLQSFRTAL